MAGSFRNHWQTCLGNSTIDLHRSSVSFEEIRDCLFTRDREERLAFAGWLSNLWFSERAGSVAMAMRFTVFLGCGTILMEAAACQFFGPTSIQVGRPVYNEVIQQTSKLQTFVNIIRVAHHEPTSFMDVSQINAQFTVQSTLMGAVSAIGAGRIGSANIGLLL